MGAGEGREPTIDELLEEIRSLRGDIEMLKASPVIGQAVQAALQHSREPDGGYAVLVRSIELPESAYNVLVAPPPEFGGGAQDA